MKKGEKMSEEQKMKSRCSNLGKKHNISPKGYRKMSKNFVKGGWNKGLKSSPEWREKVRLANLGKKYGEDTKEKHRQSLLGERNPKWKGGKTFWAKSEKKHQSGQYILWMMSVKKRDGWKCRIADKNCNGRMEAHHILNWKDYPELRYEIKNGITLCHAHHPRKRSEEARLSPYFQEIVSQTN